MQCYVTTHIQANQKETFQTERSRPVYKYTRLKEQ